MDGGGRRRRGRPHVSSACLDAGAPSEVQMCREFMFLTEERSQEPCWGLLRVRTSALLGQDVSAASAPVAAGKSSCSSFGRGGPAGQDVPPERLRCVREVEELGSCSCRRRPGPGGRLCPCPDLGRSRRNVTGRGFWGCPPTQSLRWFHWKRRRLNWILWRGRSFGSACRIRFASSPPHRSSFERKKRESGSR